MSARLNKLHAQYARRCEIENSRVQRIEAVNRYFDHWGKVTKRFDSWTTPEYYEQAENKLKLTRERKEKAINLTNRREKLRTMFADEFNALDMELNLRQRHKHRSLFSEATLEQVNKHLRSHEKSKGKLQVEADLYGRGRQCVDDGGLLYESKSDSLLRKRQNSKCLNMPYEDRAEAAEAHERKLRGEEMDRAAARTAAADAAAAVAAAAEQAEKELQLSREQEIQAIRNVQEQHMEEMKQRQQQTENLKQEEKHLRVFIDELDKERELLEASSTVVLQQPDINQAFNLKKIKVFIRQRSETFRKQIQLCISILERLLSFGMTGESIKDLIYKYKDHIEMERLCFSKIDSMYESEAKCSLQQCEDKWKEDHLQRYNEIKTLLENERNMFEAMVNENMQQQSELIDMRSTNLNEIENSTKMLKELMKEQTETPSAARDVKTTDNVSVKSMSMAKESPRSVGGGQQAIDTNNVANCAPALEEKKEEDAVSVASSKSLARSLTARSLAAPSATPAAVAADEPLEHSVPELTATSPMCNLPDKSNRICMDEISKSLNNFNIDCGNSLPSTSSDDILTTQLDKTRSMNYVTADNAERPRFGRKRVAWT